MDAYLTWGKTSSGAMEHITGVVSGKGGLICPFCEGPLIAVRGTQTQHHFRHDGKTCRESTKALPMIQGWDHFHLNLPVSVVHQLQAGYLRHGRMGTPRAYYGQETSIINNLLEKDFLYDHSGYGYRFSDDAMVIVSGFDLSEFDQWMHDKLAERRRVFVARAKAGEIHPALLAIEQRRQRELLTSTLYLFRFTLKEGRTIHKIGRTNRAPEERLVETVFDVRKHFDDNVQGEILYAIPNRGYVEQYALYRYRDCHLKMDNYQEYLELPVSREAGLCIDFDMLFRFCKSIHSVGV